MQQQNQYIYTEYVQSLSLTPSFVYFYISSLPLNLNSFYSGHRTSRPCLEKDFVWELWAANKKSFIPSISDITLQHISQQQIIAKCKVYWVTIKEWPKELLAVTPFWAKITFHAYGGLTRGRPFEICFYRLSHEITLQSFYMNMKISWYFLSNNHKNIFFHPLKKRKN